VPSPPRSLWIDALIGLVVGVFSGLFGVGGGILLVPLLVLWLGEEQKRAQATSLVVVALAAMTGAATYTLGQSVEWLAVPFLLLGGLVGAWLGSALVIRLATPWLRVAFAVLLVVAALRLIVMVVASSPASTDSVDLGIVAAVGYVVAGFAMGALSALMGVGGGIILIPVLISLFGYSQQLAAGTSLVLMVPLALLGAWRLSATGYTQWRPGLRIGVLAAVGGVGGAWLALSTPQNVLQGAFAVVLLATAIQMVVTARKE
jgi:uncharacterized protein